MRTVKESLALSTPRSRSTSAPTDSGGRTRQRFINQVSAQIEQYAALFRFILPGARGNSGAPAVKVGFEVDKLAQRMLIY